MTALLEVRDLRKRFPLRRGAAALVRREAAQAVVAVDGVSFELAPGETLGIVGESGCGKTTLARCLLRLVEPDAGEIRVGGTDLVAARGSELRRARRRVQTVFQDPYTSLNPELRVRAALAEPLRVHGVVPAAEVDAEVDRLLGLVGLPRAIGDRYARQLSGGQRQRVAIARALSVRPEVLIADEPVSALDVSIQAQLLNLLSGLVDEMSLAIVFISHDLGVVRHIADRVAVMYLGRIVEIGPTEAVLRRPEHPYTAALLAAAPAVGAGKKADRTPALVGDIPAATQIPSGCRFRTRCAYREDRCAAIDPPLDPVAPGHAAACVVRPFAR